MFHGQRNGKGKAKTSSEMNKDIKTSEKREIEGPWRAPSGISIWWTGDVGWGGDIFPSFLPPERERNSEFAWILLPLISALLCSHILNLRFYKLLPLFAWFELRIISAIGRIQRITLGWEPGTLLKHLNSTFWDCLKSARLFLCWALRAVWETPSGDLHEPGKFFDSSKMSRKTVLTFSE